ncbi:MAG: 16S rRNA (cytosine(967)-C(5))-methyltransferase RsmB [Oscillospiraceae bacterium]|nr:16S rRNA (cytosine(967)-C(5))-methyltransferase RsmB [Oscillospiraceae bacterium]
MMNRRPMSRPPQRPPENPRMTALQILQDVSRQDAYAQLALGKRLRESRLNQRDKDFVTELVYGTLERRLTLDYFLNQKLNRPDLESVARDLLRMGAYQLLFLDKVPAHAAVDESVKLTPLLHREAFSGLINQVLRAIARDKGNLPWPDRAADPAEYLSVRHSLPRWIVERLIAAYGEAEAEAIAAFRPEERRLTIRRTDDRFPPAAFEAMMTEWGWQWQQGRLPGSYTVEKIGDVGIDKGYLQGRYTVQSESSMLAALAVSPARGATVLDACAAPGGKTACLAQQMGGSGRVHAWDIHDHRVELIRSMIKRLHLDNVRPATRDATSPREDLFGMMDAVLIDAPCSGLGVMLQKPDVKYRQTTEAVAALTETQRKLFDTCANYVKPGGVLVYATCSILPEENADQVNAFLARNAAFSLDEAGLLKALPAPFAERVQGGMVQLLAHRDGTEGFFIARLRRART